MTTHKISACWGTFDLTDGGSFPFCGNAQANAREFWKDSVLFETNGFRDRVVTKPTELEVVIDVIGPGLPSEAQPFVKAIADDPSDSITRLIFGDWLDEHGLGRDGSLWCYPIMKPGTLRIQFLDHEGTTKTLVTSPVVNVPWGPSWKEFAERHFTNAIRRKMRFTNSTDVILRSLPQKPITEPIEIGGLGRLFAPPWFNDFQEATAKGGWMRLMVNSRRAIRT